MQRYNEFDNLLKLVRYNLRIIFGGRFILFVFAAFAFFILFGTTMALNAQSVEMENIYNLLTFPAILLVFYPTVFGIQRDADLRTLEIIFGIPNYRFKVWFLRLLLVFVISFCLLFPFALLAHLLLISIPIFTMVSQLTVLLIFVGTFGFCLSTIIKNGNGTAVVLIVAGLILMVISESIQKSMWNVFLNPYDIPSDMNEILWREIIYKNRIFLFSASVFFILTGLLNLQQREKFIR
jgi:hypothetical protein